MTTRPSPSRVWAPDETAADLFARLDASPLAVLPCCRGLHVGEALELFGEPGTGKSALLGEAALRCILPEAVDGVPVGGHASDAVLVDVDGTFDVLWLSEALQARALAVCGDAARAAAIAEECMRRLHVLRCATEHELLLGLHALGCLLAERGGGADGGDDAAAAAAAAATAEPPAPEEAAWLASGAARARLLLIDSLSAFQWLERARRRPSAGGGGGKGGAAAGGGLDAQVAVLLRAVLQQHRLCAVWSRTPASTHNGGADFPLDMGAAAGAAPAWAAAATHRLALKRRVDGEAAAVSYHALLTQPGGTAKAHGGPQPEFFDVQLTARGVTMARA